MRRKQISNTYRLRRNLSAVQIEVTEGVSTAHGVVVSLLNGSKIEVCGPGFDARTIKVQCDGSLYYLFSEDLQSSAEPVTRTQR